MKNVPELSMILSSSFHLDKTIGDWGNSVNYKTEDKIKSENYTITFLLDYQHLYFHLGISIKILQGDFSKEIKNIWEKINYYKNNISKKDLNGMPLRFTGLVFLITNKCNINIEEVKKLFLSHHLILTIYEIEKDSLKLVSEQITFDSSIFYDNKVIDRKKKIAIFKPNYVIWEHDDGAISYNYTATFSIGHKDKDILSANLSKISLLKEQTIDLLNTKKLRKKYNHILIESMSEALEGNINNSKLILENFNIKIKKKLILRNVILSLLPYVLFLMLFLIIKRNVGTRYLQYLNVGAFGVFGTFMSILINKRIFDDIIKYNPLEVILEILIKVIIGFSAGVIINLIMNLNTFSEYIKSNEFRYFIGFLSGWSERFLPNLIDKMEKTINVIKS